MKRILIVGSRGFIGSHLTRHLQDHSYTLLDDQPLLPHLEKPMGANTDELSRLLGDLSPEGVIHLKSLVKPGRALEDFQAQYDQTVLPAINIAKTLPSTVKLAVFFGSFDEYGNGPVPFREDQTLASFSPYGWAKIAAFHGLTVIAKQREIPWCWARPSLVFGPGQRGDSLIPAVIRGCRENRQIPLTPGSQTRDFIFVDDLCKMTIKILENPQKAQNVVVNLCSGVPRTVRDVATSIQKTVGQGVLQFGAIDYRKDEAMAFYGSTARFSELFGVVPLTDFDEALAKTIHLSLKNVAIDSAI